MTFNIPGLIAKHATDYISQNTVNRDHRAGGKFVLPVEPAQMSHHEKFVVHNDTGVDCTLRVRVAWKGTVLWMPNTGRDTNYVNLGYLWDRTKHEPGVKIKAPKVGDMRRSKKMREFAVDGDGTTRHMVTGNGTELMHDTRLNSGRACTYWLASTAQIDTSRDAGTLRPTIFAWGGINYQWELVTL